MEKCLYIRVHKKSYFTTLQKSHVFYKILSITSRKRGCKIIDLHKKLPYTLVLKPASLFWMACIYISVVTVVEFIREKASSIDIQTLIYMTIEFFDIFLRPLWVKINKNIEYSYWHMKNYWTSPDTLKNFRTDTIINVYCPRIKNQTDYSSNLQSL